LKVKTIKFSGLAVIGIIIGLLTGYLRSYNPRSLWTFSDVAGRYGFWILTVSVIALLSTTARKAAIGSFVYMLFMCIAYYTYLYICKNVAYMKQFVFWICFALLTSGMAYLINRTKDEKYKYRRMVKVIPLLSLAIEGLNMVVCVLRYKTNLFQALVDCFGFIILSIMMARKENNKGKFIPSAVSILISVPIVIYLST
jgi:hypothetical protein